MSDPISAGRDEATPVGARNWYLAAFALLAAAVFFWWRALFQGKMVIHGETIHFDLPMMALQSRMFDGAPGILWNDFLYGGFPLFAEGQAAFANPLKLALALALDPISAMMGYHFLATFLGALGILLLARMIGLTPLAALFSSLAGGFSMQWIFFHNAMVGAGTLAMAPWVLLAAEHWLRYTNRTSVLFLAVAAALMVLAGYPMFAHGVGVYIVFRMATELLHSDGRQLLRGKSSRLLGSGVAAIALALGLCAVQIIPLLELVGESHRSEGINLAFPSIPNAYLIKGFLFSYIGSSAPDLTLNLPSLGSAFVSILFLAGVLLCTNRGVIAHAVAAILLGNLGLQDASPFFRVAYEYHLIPGLHSFRYMFPYLGIAVIGFAIVAGGALDALSSGAALRRFRHHQNQPWLAGGVLLAISAFVSLVAFKVYVPQYGAMQFCAAVAVTPLYLACLMGKRQRLFLPAALCLLVIECFIFRFGVFHFSERSLLKEPVQAQAIKSDAGDASSWRAMDLTNASGFGFLPPDDPTREAKFSGMIDSLTPMASLLWNIPTIDSVSSLGLRRRYMLYDQLREEFLGHRGRPDTRFIDVLGIRYVTKQPGLKLVNAREIFSAQGKWSVYKNPYALPHFQLYKRARVFKAPTDVLENWPDRKPDQLYIDSTDSVSDLEASTGEGGKSSVAIVNTGSDQTTLKVTTTTPMWLFMADADYPGWQVYVNGKETKHYSAQILGKAVHVPAGENTVKFVFASRSVRIGAMLSLMSLLILMFLSVLVWRARRNNS